MSFESWMIHIHPDNLENEKVYEKALKHSKLAYVFGFVFTRKYQELLVFPLQGLETNGSTVPRLLLSSGTICRLQAAVHLWESSASRPGQCCVDGLLPARRRTVWRCCQCQAADQWCGVWTPGGVEVRILVQTSRIPRDGAVEAGALEFVVLVGGRVGGAAWAQGGVLWRRWWSGGGGGGGAVVVTGAHLFCFDLRFLAVVLIGVTAGRRRWTSSRWSAWGSGSPDGAAAGVWVEVGENERPCGIVMHMVGVRRGEESRAVAVWRQVLVQLMDVKSIDVADDICAEFWDVHVAEVNVLATGRWSRTIPTAVGVMFGS